MIITRRQHYKATTALKTSLAPAMGYEIPSDQPVREIPAHLIDAGRKLGLSFGQLAITRTVGRA